MSASSQFVATPLAPTRGVVESFDDPRGLGIVRSEVGTPYPFHCTSILGEARTISEGIDVTFTVVAGRHGRWEAAGLQATGSSPSFESVGRSD
jgi:cold shock CspA family protein